MIKESSDPPVAIVDVYIYSMLEDWKLLVNVCVSIYILILCL